MSTKDLVNAIISGDAIEIETAFQSTMADKISAQLDIRRQEVAQNLFKTESTVVAEQSEQLDELSKDTLKSYVGKAASDAAAHAYIAGGGTGVTDKAITNKHYKKAVKRINTIPTAARKLSNEELEEARIGAKTLFKAGQKAIANIKVAEKQKEQAKKSEEDKKKVVEQLVVTNVESALYAMQDGRNILDEAFDEAVSVSSKNNYENTHGKKPKGNGNWYFTTIVPSQHDLDKHADQTVNVTGTFADAAKKAQSHFKQKGHAGEIHVLT